MFWTLLIFACVANAADHNIFKNCSRVPFCANMRHQQLDEDSQFKADIAAVQLNGTTASIPLVNSKGDNFVLKFLVLENTIMRVQIAEPDSTRYQLQYVLEREPRTAGFATIHKDTTLEILPYSENDVSLWKAVIHQGPPFSIQFYTDLGAIGPTLRGDKFVIRNTSQEFSFTVDFDSALKLYGLHHHSVDLELPDTENTDPFRLRNSDNPGYEVGSPMALYGSVPVVYGHSATQTTGIFLHNAAEQWIDISYKSQNPSAYFMVESGSLDLFVMLGTKPRDVVRQFTSLTGHAPLPPLWTLGYHQSRWNYWTQEEVKDVVALMDKHDFPMDAIWLDIGYTDGKRYFTWDPTSFNDPVEMQQNISATGRKLVTIIDPHIKVDEDYPFYAGAKGKYFVKWANGSDFEGVCWPGLSSYIDFLNREARDYYSAWYSYDKFNGSTTVLAGIWNDMNEPSVFDDTTEKTFPFELVHDGNVLHRDIHNIYGLLHSMSTYQGLMVRDKNFKRPFILSRSHFAGSQRFAAMWTGDNTADWPYLRVSYSECINANLMGHVFCGADIGGFSGNPDVELLQRWYQAAVWLTFFRGHAENSTEHREPYVFPENVQTVIRRALKLRYKHISYFYTLFFEHMRRSDPVIRPLFYQYPGLVDRDEYILIGENILATPVMHQGATNISVSLPGWQNESWYRVDDESWSIHNSNSTLLIPTDISTSPYFYKSGSIIMRKDIERRSTTDMLNDPFNLYVNLNDDGTGSGRLYVDDYTSFEYWNEVLAYLEITYKSPGTINIRLLEGEDGTPLDINIDQIIVHGPPKIEGHHGTRMVFTHTSDGTLLKKINIMKSMHSRKLHLKLKVQ